MGVGPLWAKMHVARKHVASELSRDEVPTATGVYAWYRNGEPIYSGRAGGKKGLRERIWGTHLNATADLSRSSFRRNVCEYLEIASTSEARVRPTLLTPADVEPVNTWIRGCEVAWIKCGSRDEAADLEARLHKEWLPPLSKR